jgi:membrane-associated phospholipid phosphatase
MLKKLLVTFLLLSTTAVVQPAIASTPPATNAVASNELVSEFLTELTVRVSRDRVAPTKSSRLYAYVAYAMFLASAPNDDPLFVNLGDVPKLPPRAESIDPVVAALAAGTSVARNIFLVTAARTTFGEFRDRILRSAGKDLSASVEKESVDYGISVADAVVARTKTDGFEESKKAVAPDVKGPGIWVPTQPGYQPAIDPGWGAMMPFFVGTKKCSLPTPPKSGVAQSPFQGAADEVATVAKNLTEEQKSIARFWDDSRGRTGTPSGHWLVIALAAAKEKEVDAVTLIRVVAHTSMAVADAFIVNFGEKYKHMVERPITVLQRSDPQWSSYLPTPAFPEYPSGHSTISKTAADVLTSYFGIWSFTDPGYGLTQESRSKFEVTPRTFSSFDAAAQEASISRLYGGIHFTIGLTSGVTLGACVASKTL